MKNNPEKGILIVSGNMSQVAAFWLASDVKPTRLDVCVDLFTPDKSTRVRDNFDAFYNARKGDPEKGKNLTRYESPNGGYTLYYGKRGKGMMLRAYDKGSQLEGRPNLWWRYELQFGREYAVRAVNAMLSSQDVTQWQKGVVVKFCKDRDIPVVELEHNDTHWIASSMANDVNEKYQRSIVYFTGVVVPFVKRFIGQAGIEYVVKELGLSPYLDLKGEMWNIETAISPQKNGKE